MIHKLCNWSGSRCCEDKWSQSSWKRPLTSVLNCVSLCKRFVADSHGRNHRADRGPVSQLLGHSAIQIAGQCIYFTGSVQNIHKHAADIIINGWPYHWCNKVRRFVSQHFSCLCIVARWAGKLSPEILQIAGSSSWRMSRTMNQTLKFQLTSLRTSRKLFDCTADVENVRCTVSVPLAE